MRYKRFGDSRSSFMVSVIYDSDVEESVLDDPLVEDSMLDDISIDWKKIISFYTLWEGFEAQPIVLKADCSFLLNVKFSAATTEEAVCTKRWCK